MAGDRVWLDLRPLRESPPFRRVFIARTVSIFGIGLVMVGLPVQVYALTRSSVLVGVVTAVEGVTAFAGMLCGGVLADRFDRRRLILAARIVAGASFVGLAVNAMAPSPSMAVIIAMAVINGGIGSISVATLFAVVPTLIPAEQITGVGALNVLSARAGAVIAPAVGGAVIAASSVAWNYWAGAAASVVTVLLLWGLPAMPPHAPPAPGSAADHGDVDRADPAGADDRSVLGFLRADAVVRSVMIVGVLAMFGSGVLVLVPGLVAERFGDDARAVGVLYAAGAVGAVLATVTSGWLGTLTRPGPVLYATLVAGFGVQALAGVPTVLVGVIAVLVAAGFLTSVQEVLRYSLIQVRTPHRMLGRVNGLWAAQEVTGISLGALIAGMLGGWWAPSTALIAYGAILAGIAVLVLPLTTALWRRDPHAGSRGGAAAGAGADAQAAPPPSVMTNQNKEDDR